MLKMPAQCIVNSLGAEQHRMDSRCCIEVPVRQARISYVEGILIAIAHWTQERMTPGNPAKECPYLTREKMAPQWRDVEQCNIPSSVARVRLGHHWHGCHCWTMDIHRERGARSDWDLCTSRRHLHWRIGSVRVRNVVWLHHLAINEERKVERPPVEVGWCTGKPLRRLQWLDVSRARSGIPFGARHHPRS